MRVYLGTFLIAFATLVFEVTLARLLSVTSWYYLGFFTIATAMLGMTAAAVTIFLKPESFPKEDLDTRISQACFAFALVVPLSVIMLCLTPLAQRQSVMSLFSVLLATLASAVPFYFAGIAITLVLTKVDRPIDKLYASDLIGASLGCLFVLGGLEVLDAPSLILLAGAIGALAAICFSRPGSGVGWGRYGRVCAALVIVGLVNSTTSRGIRPFVVKGEVEHTGSIIHEKWNSYSRVVVMQGAERPPFYWGPSPVAPMKKKVYRYAMSIDGAAGTALGRFSSLEDIDHLRYDVTTVGYHLRRAGGACIIGVGGGRDLQSAILFGHEQVVGVDVNPTFIRLLEGPFREFAGLADRDGVELVADEARSYLSRDTRHYSIIQMSLIDTWAATGAGAFSLSENVLYTVEAWKLFLDRLADDGIFTVSRWYNPANLAETGRLLSLAAASLLESGTPDPERHLALVTSGRIATLLLSKQPLSERDLTTIEKVCADLQYGIALLPGSPPDNDVLRRIVAANSMQELADAVENELLNYSPPTDDDPYFFNMLRLGHALGLPPELSQRGGGVVDGNLVATFTLAMLVMSLSIVTLATIVIPLLVKTQSQGESRSIPPVLWSAAAYFSLIGAGFMLVEITLIQRLSVFLTHPIHGLGILLFTIILSAGVGSLLSGRLPLTRRPWVFVYPLATAAAIVVMRFALPPILAGMMTSPISTRIVASVLLLFPLGILMGLFFPTGMRLVKDTRASETPWYWALNGVSGVLCSTLAVFCSIYVGMSTTLCIAAVCYAAAMPCAAGIRRAGTAAAVD